MDWHFRQNRRLKEKKRIVSREWFVGDDDWINERDNKNQKVLPFQEAVEATVDKEDVLPAIVYNDEDIDAVCGICNEPFEKYWDEVEEEWMFRNAIKLDRVHYFYNFLFNF